MGAITQTSHKNNQNAWNLFSTLIFLILFVSAVYYLYQQELTPLYITFFDATLIVLAVFRLTRLFVSDGVTRFIRDFFIIKEEITDKDGHTLIVRKKYDDGFLRNISDLLGCSWCVSVWLGLVVSFFYFFSYLAWFPIFVLAIAGFASLIQIIINLIGWRAEQIKSLVDDNHN